MGANESSIQEKFELEIGEALPKNSGVYKIWTSVSPCIKHVQTSKSRKNLSSLLFIRKFAETDSQETIKFFQNGIQNLKQLRHPSILIFCESNLIGQELRLFTEPARPLDLAISSLLPIEVHTGLIQAGICHNNINPSAIFVTPDGWWKLAGFECAQKMENNKHWVQSDFVKSVKEEDFSPPEDKQIFSKDIPAIARDAFGFGKLIVYSMQYMKDYLSDAQELQLTEVIDRLTNPDPTLRGELGSLPISFSSAFSNDLTEIVDFLDNIQLKNESDKSQFFESVLEKVSHVPQEIIAKNLVKLFLSRYVMLEPEAHVSLIPLLLTPKDDEQEEKGLLSILLYRQYVVNEVLKIFRVRDATIRIALLAHFPSYVCQIPVERLEDLVLEELVLGMRDTNPKIVSASLHAMAELVPILGPEKVTGLQHLKSFSDGAPKQRSNSIEAISKFTQLTTSSYSKNTASQLAEELKNYKMNEREYMESIEKSVEIIKSVQEPVMDVKVSGWGEENRWEEDWDEENVEIDEDPIKLETIELSEPKIVDKVVKTSSIAPASELLPVEEQLDLFAGMEPKIEKAPTLEDTLISLSIVQNLPKTTPTKSSPKKSETIEDPKLNQKSNILEMDASLVEGSSEAWKPDDDDLVLDLEAD